MHTDSRNVHLLFLCSFDIYVLILFWMFNLVMFLLPKHIDVRLQHLWDACFVLYVTTTASIRFIPILHIYKSHQKFLGRCVRGCIIKKLNLKIFPLFSQLVSVGFGYASFFNKQFVSNQRAYIY